MHQLSGIFEVVGLSFVSYSIGRLLNSLSLYLEDSNTHRFLRTISGYSCYVFYFFGIIGAAIVHLVQAYPNKRAEKSAREEERESMKAIADIDIRSAVSAEGERLNEHYHELMRDQAIKIRSEESELWRSRLHEVLEKREAGRE